MRSLCVFEAASEAPEQLAIIAPELRLTYRELAQAIATSVDRLRQDPEVPVAIAPTLTWRSVLWIYAVITAGRPLLLFHPFAAAEERERQRRVVGAELELGGEPAAGTPEIEPQIEPSRTLAYVFTSGTTGQPKAVVLSRRAFAAAARAHASNLPWKDEDRWGLFLPPAHVGGLSVLTRALWARRTVVLGPSRFDEPEVIRTIEQEKVTILSFVPTMLGRLLDHGWTGCSCLRAVLLGGAPASDSLLDSAQSLGAVVMPTYGMTETCAQVATSDGRLPGVGRPLPGVAIRIRDKEIQVRGPTLFDGYLHAPWPFLPGGWFPTGDLGELDDNGALHVVGRLDDLIISGGENVHPAALERVLAEDPRIQSGCVFGLPDAEWGQIVAVAVVPSGSEAEAHAAIDALEARVARHERPRRRIILRQLPRTHSGKVSRAELRAISRGAPVSDAENTPLGS